MMICPFNLNCANLDNAKDYEFSESLDENTTDDILSSNTPSDNFVTKYDNIRGE